MGSIPIVLAELLPLNPLNAYTCCCCILLNAGAWWSLQLAPEVLQGLAWVLAPQ
jgi:hypothetical protein